MSSSSHGKTLKPHNFGKGYYITSTITELRALPACGEMKTEKLIKGVKISLWKLLDNSSFIIEMMVKSFLSSFGSLGRI